MFRKKKLERFNLIEIKSKAEKFHIPSNNKKVISKWMLMAFEFRTQLFF